MKSKDRTFRARAGLSIRLSLSATKLLVIFKTVIKSEIIWIQWNGNGICFYWAINTTYGLWWLWTDETSKTRQKPSLNLSLSFGHSLSEAEVRLRRALSGFVWTAQRADLQSGDSSRAPFAPYVGRKTRAAIVAINSKSKTCSLIRKSWKLLQLFKTLIRVSLKTQTIFAMFLRIRSSSPRSDSYVGKAMHFQWIMALFLVTI